MTSARWGWAGDQNGKCPVSNIFLFVSDRIRSQMRDRESDFGDCRKVTLFGLSVGEDSDESCVHQDFCSRQLGPMALKVASGHHKSVA